MQSMQSKQQVARSLLESYYTAFNAQDIDAFLELLSDDVIHDINQGQRQFGKTAFAEFMGRISACYREHIFDIHIMTNEDGSRAAAEYTVLGVYIANDQGFPPAHGQSYRLIGGAFFEICNSKIVRVNTYYNLQDWMVQVT